MPEPLEFYALPRLREIEVIRKSRVLVLAASNFDMEILPALQEQLDKIGRIDKLDVVLHSRGGIVNATRRIALLLRKYAKSVNFIVPYYCESSGTILALSGNEVIAGNLAIFTPIDPHLHGGAEGSSTALSCLDIMQFGKMCEDWFGVDSQQANAEQISVLCNSIFPPTLTTFYRVAAETQNIAEELLRLQLPDEADEKVSRLIEQLMYGYNSHHYAITTEEMASLGFKCFNDSAVESLAWDISKNIQSLIGGGARNSLEDPWNDVLILSSEGGQVRHNFDNGLMPGWTSINC